MTSIKSRIIQELFKLELTKPFLSFCSRLSQINKKTKTTP